VASAIDRKFPQIADHMATLRIPPLCSEDLHNWVGMLTKEDKKLLNKWDVTPRMLDMIKVPIDTNLLAVLAARWNPELHIFQMHDYKMIVTLEETQFLCQT
jgi:hypothetical protein